MIDPWDQAPPCNENGALHLLHVDVGEGGPDALEDVDDEVVVLGGVEREVAGQQVLELRRRADAVLRDHLLHGLPEVPPRVPRRLHHREALRQRRRLRRRRRRRGGGRRRLVGLSGRRDAHTGRVRARLEPARCGRRHGPPRLAELRAALFLEGTGGSPGCVGEHVDVLVFRLGFAPRRRLGHDRPEQFFRLVMSLGAQVNDDLRGGGDHLAVETVVVSGGRGADGDNRRGLLDVHVIIVVVAVAGEPVAAARRRVRRLDGRRLGLAPAPARGHRRRREPAAAADRVGELDGPPPVVVVATLGRPPRRRERQRREPRVGGLGVVVERRRRAGEDELVPRARRVVVRRSVRQPRAAVLPRSAAAAGRSFASGAARRGWRRRRRDARAGRRAAAAAGAAHVAELEEPRVRDHVGQPELVPPHAWLRIEEATGTGKWITIVSSLQWFPALHEVEVAQRRDMATRAE